MSINIRPHLYQIKMLIYRYGRLHTQVHVSAGPSFSAPLQGYHVVAMIYRVGAFVSQVMTYTDGGGHACLPVMCGLDHFISLRTFGDVLVSHQRIYSLCTAINVELYSCGRLLYKVLYFKPFRSDKKTNICIRIYCIKTKNIKYL